MSQATETYTADALDADVRRYLQLDEARKEIEMEQTAIKTRIRALGVGHHDAPCGVSVNVSVNRRFDPRIAEDTLPAELLAACRTETVDAKKAKATLPPAAYDACMREVGEPRVAVS